jgi:hypothetical protein
MKFFSKIKQIGKIYFSKRPGGPDYLYLRRRIAFNRAGNIGTQNRMTGWMKKMKPVL